MISIQLFSFMINNGPVQVRMDPTARVVKVEDRHPLPGLSIWAITDSTHVPMPRAFVARGTGDEIKDGEIYVGSTTPTPSPVYLWHLFEVAS